MFELTTNQTLILLGMHFSVNRWRTATFRRALAVGLWMAATKLLPPGK